MQGECGQFGLGTPMGFPSQQVPGRQHAASVPRRTRPRDSHWRRGAMTIPHHDDLIGRYVITLYHSLP
jgi:hypothetical protein